MYGCRVIQKVLNDYRLYLLATWYNHCKEFFLVGPLLFPFKTHTLVIWPYMHITEGNRGGWSGPKNKDGYWAWWSYHEMCTRSKWKPCYPEMYWMCPRRFYPVYNIDILWSCCSIINPPLWLQSHTGEVLHLHASVLSLVLMRFTVFFSLCREYLSTVLIQKHSK